MNNKGQTVVEYLLIVAVVVVVMSVLGKEFKRRLPGPLRDRVEQIYGSLRMKQ